MGNIIKWVQGNPLRLAIPLQKVTITQGGKTTENYIPLETETVKVVLESNKSYWRKYEYTPTSITDNVVVVEDNSKLPAGKYDVTILVLENEELKRRSKWLYQIEVFDSNENVLDEYDDFPDYASGALLDSAIFFFAKGDKGDKGDPLTWDDLTEEQKAEIKGEKGDKGDTGEGFSIYKTYSSVASMVADKNNVPLGKFTLIASNVDDEDNAKLYVRVDSIDPYVFLTDLSGAQGIQGEQGAQGIQGEQGEKGDPFTYSDFTAEQLAALRGPQGDKGDKGDPMRYEDLSPAQIESLRGPKGDKGDTGATGAAGATGPAGQDGVTPHIDSTSKHWFIGSTDTGIVAEGQDGQNGTNGTNGTNGVDGVTPHIDSSNKHWMIGSEDTGVVAEGQNGRNGTNGTNGANGITPNIDSTTGNWFIGGQDTGVHAQGPQGEPGTTPDISGKEDVTPIVAQSTAISTLTAEVGKYYRLDVAVETLAITLPTMTGVTNVKTITFYMTGGTTPGVTFTSTHNVYLADFTIESGKTYEVNAAWNGASWIVAAVNIVISNS